MTISDMTLEVRSGILCATLSGDIDMSNVQQIRREIGEVLTNQATGLVIDLSAVDYLDSAGMHLVHNLRSSLRSHGQQLALVVPDGSVINDALRLAGVDWKEMRIASCDDAADAFGLPTSADG